MCVGCGPLSDYTRAPENHINVAAVGNSNGMACFSPGVILCLTLP